MDNKILIEVNNLTKSYDVKKRLFKQKNQANLVNDNISFDIYRGETLGIVGESGSGKSTLGKAIIQLIKPTSGVVRYHNIMIDEFYPKYPLRYYKHLVKIVTRYHENPNNLKALSDYKTLTSLLGGLLAYYDLDLVSKLSGLKYRYAQLLLAANDAKKSKYQRLLDDVNGQIDKIRLLLKNDPNYLKLEAMRNLATDLTLLTNKENRSLKKDLQIVFQDPYGALDGRLTIKNIIGEGLLVNKICKSKNDPNYLKIITKIMKDCNLSADDLKKYPHQFSGGQRQRIAIARALVLKPKLLVCDEAVSALDVLVQLQILKLLNKLKTEYGLTYLFISHDLGVVKHLCDRIAVIYLGKLVELGSVADIFTNPVHPYTKELLDAIVPLNDADFVGYQNKDYKLSFNYLDDKVADKDWYQISDGHYVLCTK